MEPALSFPAAHAVKTEYPPASENQQIHGNARALKLAGYNEIGQRKVYLVTQIAFSSAPLMELYSGLNLHRFLRIGEDILAKAKKASVPGHRSYFSIR
jgi:hypothetical protein